MQWELGLEEQEEDTNVGRWFNELRAYSFTRRNFRSWAEEEEEAEMVFPRRHLKVSPATWHISHQSREIIIIKALLSFPWEAFVSNNNNRRSV